MRAGWLAVGFLFLLSVLPGCFYSEASKAERVKEIVLEAGKVEGLPELYVKGLVDADAAKRVSNFKEGRAK